MTEEEKELWEIVKHKMREEGFNYCFEGYSNWEEIKDRQFHKLRKNYLQSAKFLKEYINKKAEQIEL